GHDRVQHGVGDLVGQLVGVALGDRLGGEQVSQPHVRGILSSDSGSSYPRSATSLLRRSRIAPASSRFLQVRTGGSSPVAPRIMAWLVSLPKPVPSRPTSFTTIRSRCL